MDTTQLIAVIGTAVAGIGTGAGLVWRFMTAQIVAQDAEIKRLNDERVRLAEQSARLTTNYRIALGKAIEVVRAQKVTLDAREDR